MRAPHDFIFIDSTFNVITSLHHAMMQIFCKFISSFFCNTFNYPYSLINLQTEQVIFLGKFHFCYIFIGVAGLNPVRSQVLRLKVTHNICCHQNFAEIFFCKIAIDILSVCQFIPNSEEERDSPVLVLLIRFLLHGEPLRIVGKL